MTRRERDIRRQANRLAGELLVADCDAYEPQPESEEEDWAIRDRIIEIGERLIKLGGGK